MRNVLADLYFQAGDYSSSKKTSSNILNKSKNNADARFNLCRIDLKEGQLLAAIGGLRQLVSENPAVAHYKYYLGMAHELRGELLMAEDAYKQTLELAVDHKEALVKWASLHAKRARSSELKMRIEKYLAIHPYDKEISALHNDLINQGTTGIMLIEQN
jgi:tetratricopeptide (TPR) repeat protein